MVASASVKVLHSVGIKVSDAKGRHLRPDVRASTSVGGEDECCSPGGFTLPSPAEFPLHDHIDDEVSWCAGRALPGKADSRQAPRALVCLPLFVGAKVETTRVPIQRRVQGDRLGGDPKKAAILAGAQASEQHLDSRCVAVPLPVGHRGDEKVATAVPVEVRSSEAGFLFFLFAVSTLQTVPPEFLAGCTVINRPRIRPRDDLRNAVAVQISEYRGAPAQAVVLLLAADGVNGIQ